MAGGISLSEIGDLTCEHVSTCPTCGTLLPPGDEGNCADCAVELAAEMSAVDCIRGLEAAADFLARPGSPSSHRMWALAVNALAAAINEHFSDPEVAS